MSAVGGKLIVVGGINWNYSPAQYAEELEEYDPVIGRWSITMKVATRVFAAAATIGDSVHVVGDLYSSAPPYLLGAHEQFRPTSTYFVFKKN